MGEGGRLLLLVLILIVAVTIATGVTVGVLYRASIIEQRGRLLEAAQSQARLIEAIARHEEEYSYLHGQDPVESTLAALTDAHAHYEGSGSTGEFTLGRLDGDQIAFLLTHRHDDLKVPLPVPLDSDLAEPMRRALSGKSGTLVGLDYRGQLVLAAHEPVAELDLGIVAKIDLDEVQAPFHRAGLVIIGSAIAAVLLGAVLLRQIVGPLLRRLIRTEEQYRTLVETMTEGLTIQDERGIRTYANDHFCDMIGRTRGEIIGKPTGTFLDEASRERLARELVGRRTGDDTPYELTFIHKDGQPVYARVAPRTIMDRQGRYRGSFAVIGEITHLKATEEALQREKERFQNLLDIVGVAIVAVERDGRTVSLANRRICKILGYPESEIVGKDWFSNFIPEHRRKRALGSLELGLSGALPPLSYAENTILTRDGNERWIAWHNATLHDENGEVAGWLSSGEDITERKRSETALARYAKQLQTVAEVGRRISSILDQDILLRYVVTGIQERFGYYHIDFFLVDAAREYVEFTVGSNPAVDGEWRERGLRFKIGSEGMIGWVAGTGTPLMTGDVSQEPRYLADELLPETRSELVVPITIDDEVFGILDVQSDERDAFSSDDLALLEALSSQISVALENARLYTAMQKELSERQRAEAALRESEERYRSSIDSMADAIHVVDEHLKILMMNRTFKAWAGRLGLETEVEGRSLFEVFPFLPVGTRESCREVLQTGKPAHVEERILVEGQEILTEVHRIPILEEGKPRRIMTIVRDVTAQRKTEESATQLGRILEDSLNEIYLFDVDTLSFVRVNEGARKNLGYSMEELRGLTPLDLKTEFTRESFEQLVEPLRTGRRRAIDFATMHRRKNGSTYPVEVHLQLSTLEARPLFVAIILDVTNRRRAEEERDRILNLSHELIYVAGFDGTFKYVNPAWERTLGYTQQELLSRPFLEFIHPDDHARSAAEIERLREGHETVGFENRYVHKDGSVRTLSWTATPLLDERLLYYVGRDITDRKRTEEALRANELRYRSLFENAILGIYQTTPDGRILAANPALVGMLGFRTFDELSDRNLETNGYAPEYPRHAFRKRLERDGQVTGFEAAWKCRDGSTVFVRENARVVRDEDGRILYYEGTVEDITGKRKVEAAKRALEAQLRQNQKLESIGTFASGIAHEINNPLTGIINYAQLITDRVQDETLQRFSAGIIEEGRRVARIVQNLLSFARQDREAHSPACIRDIIHAALSLFLVMLRKDAIDLRLDIPEDLPRIKCRSQQIQQVIVNLLINARDALNERYAERHPNKILKISARITEREGTPWVRTTVEDHGGGIPHDMLARVFDPFFTTKPRDRGTGLGLSVSYGIVRDHDGELTAESDHGEPTRFHLDLPIDNGWPSPRGSEPRDVTEGPTAGETSKTSRPQRNQGSPRDP